ncbi:MAG: ParB N-terminal domain-containing protein [Desulfobulbus sp.]
MLTPQIVILPQIEDLLYPLKSEELAHLEASIAKEGVRDPLVVWKREEETILIDGHHRYAIARKLDIEFDVKEIHFEDMKDVLDWVDKNQLGRRNLTDEERTLTIGRIYQRVRDQRAAARVGTAESSGETGSALQHVADGWNVSTGTIKRASDFASAIELLKSLGDEGSRAANRILAGDVADGITELPKVFKTDSDKFPELATGLCAGQKKIRDIIPKSSVTSREPEQQRPDRTVNPQPVENADLPPIDAQRYTTFGSDADHDSEDDFFHDAGEESASPIPGLETSPVEIQANVLQLFTAMDCLLRLNPKEVRDNLPQYVVKQIAEHIQPTAQWLQDFAQSEREQAHG